MNFWNKWPKEDKIIYGLSFIVFLVTVTLLLVNYARGFEELIEIKQSTSFSNISVIIDSFNAYLVNFDINAENYLIRKQYLAGELHLAQTGSIIFLALSAFASIIYISAITRITKIFWFSALMTPFIAWVYFLKIDLIGVFGYFNNIFLITTLSLFILVAFLFHAVANNASFLIRIITFTAITGFLTWVALEYSEIDKPLIMLSHNVIIYPTLLCLVFLVLTSGDIITFFAGLINETSQGEKGGFNNLYKLLSISVLYLGNLFVYYLNFSGVIEFQLIYFDPFFLVIVTAVLGIWGHKRRNEAFTPTNVPFDGIGNYIYIALATVSIAAMYFCFASGNTAMEKLFEETILILHITIGSTFLLYVVHNFSSLMFKNINFNDILFRYDGLPFFATRIAAVFLTIIWLGSNFDNKISLFKAGKYTYQGVAYMLNNDEILAKSAFYKASTLDRGNPVATYIMANFSSQKVDKTENKKLLVRIIDNNPREFAYLNLSELYFNEGDIQSALNTLKLGLEKFPNSAYLHNNLALRFEELNKIDSSALHFTIATRDEKEKVVAITNLIALCVTQKYDDLIDTLLSEGDFGHDISFQTNKLVASNFFKKNYSFELNNTFIKDSVLVGLSLPYAHNFATRDLRNVPKIVLDKIIATSRQESLNANTINYLKGLILVHNKNGWLGKKILEGLAKDSNPEAQNYYYRLLGLIFLQNENYTLAERTLSNNSKIQLYRAFDDAPLANAISYFANNKYDAFKEAVEHISYTDSTNKSLAKDLLFAVNAEERDYLDLSDIQKSYYLISHPHVDPFLIKGIGNPYIKAFTINKKVNQLLANNKLDSIDLYWQELPSISYSFTKKTELNIKLARKEFNDVITSTKDSREFYYERAVAFDSLGKNDEANIVYKKALNTTPFNSKLIIAASDFLAYKMNDDEKSYNLILDAVINDELNIEIKKTYIKRCLEQHLTNFAESVEVDLAEMISDEELRTFALETKFNVADYHASRPEIQEFEFID